MISNAIRTLLKNQEIFGINMQLRYYFFLMLIFWFGFGNNWRRYEIIFCFQEAYEPTSIDDNKGKRGKFAVIQKNLLSIQVFRNVNFGTLLVNEYKKHRKFHFTIGSNYIVTIRDAQEYPSVRPHFLEAFIGKSASRRIKLLRIRIWK